MIEAICHCGNVRLEVSNLPASITSCNCSICNRLGALWVYFSLEEVDVSFKKEPTSEYIWGDKCIKFHHCTHCGCTTHYTSTEKCEEKRVAINCRMMKPEIIKSIHIRKFDGAVS